ncbi:MAG: 3-isopropylmalate dehydratase small subunit [Ramlibacter sp.]|jgi:3-isopropylmalate/(R)-2-methylmalate dehydratase small subunit|nr:3-isopropylmalate dehydratase small subunit [Ramlibacter sp.]
MKREPLRVVESVAAPLEAANIDTDQVIPARFIQKPRANDFGAWLFLDVRRDAEGKSRPDFVLNDPAYAGAHILVAGPNFGCGSSREHAVWALADGGIRVVIAPSFGDIFYGNALKNALLPIVLPLDTVRALQAALRAAPGAQVRVDLVGQRVQGPGIAPAAFTIDSFARRCLLEGLDEIDYTLTLEGEIARFEKEMNP